MTIHCIWLGGTKTALARRCRASWTRFAPDWEIREWNEIPPEAPAYVRAAAEARKWAFVSDWLRFWILEREGGVYFDFDVELVRPLTESLSELGVLSGEWCALEWLKTGAKGYAPGAGLALARGSAFARRMLKVYETEGFDGKTTVGDLMTRHGITPQGIEPEVFCPFDWEHHSLRTDKTIGVHHYALSWISPRRRVAKWFIWHGMGWLVNALLRFKRS